MKKLLFLLVIVAAAITSANAQGFKKASNTVRLGNYEIGNYYLYKHTADSFTVYSFTMRDKKYNSKTFLQVKVGDKQETISFLENAIATFDTMEKGDRFELGLPDGNIGFYVNNLGVKALGITVGDLGEYGQISKAVLKSMLSDMQKE